IVQSCPSSRQAPNEPWKISVRSGACAIHRTRRRRALDGDLARLHTGAPDGPLLQLALLALIDRCGARPVLWAAGTARAPTPPRPGGHLAQGKLASLARLRLMCDAVASLDVTLAFMLRGLDVVER